MTTTLDDLMPNPDETKLAVNFSWMVSWEFGLLERHRKEMYASLDRVEDKAGDMYKEFREEIELSYEYIMDVPEYDLMAEEYRTATEFLPRLQWNAQFLMVFSTFEHLICRLAEIAQTRFKQKVSYRDFAGTGFEPAYQYLAKVAELGPTTFKTAEWKTVLVYKKLRNILAHTSGEFKFSKDPSNLSQQLRAFNGWSIDDNEEGKLCRISLDSQFLAMAIATLQNAALQVCNAKIEPNDNE